MRSSVLFWYFLISLSATVPGRKRWGFFTPPVAGADFRAAFVASCFRGTFPVKKIPEIFSSKEQYANSFKVPLMEETRASLCCGMESIGQAPACEISKIELSKNHKTPKDLYYNIMAGKIRGSKNPGGHYEPEAGDLIVLTINTKPKKMDDLISPDQGQPSVIAWVGAMEEGSDMTLVLASEEIDPELWPMHYSRVKVYATYLMNMTTNMRIWRGLHGIDDLNLVAELLRPQPDASEDCSICTSQANFLLMEANISGMIKSFKLNESQQNAILSSIGVRKCSHGKSKVKLIWGPPGTGKTKTVACLLFTLLRLKCRTLACAPTNIAVLQLSKRFLDLVKQSFEFDTYGLGDIVLFGNGERMKMDNHDELLEVFLDYRTAILSKCLSPFMG